VLNQKASCSRTASLKCKSDNDNNVNCNIVILRRREHSKASEEYVDVIFKYPDSNYIWKGSVPIVYRRTNTFAETDEDIMKIVKSAYNAMNPKNIKEWLEEEENFWQQSRKVITKSFFDALKDSEWKCVNCQLPKNPNWARRIQDIKELGYTIATNTKMFCENCNKNTTHLVLLKLPRSKETGYEKISSTLRKRILKVLNNHDAYENKKGRHLLPDHKFPEIRWDETTREENPDDMSDDEIKRKFQLLSNQRNLEKREVCRKCFQEGYRGTPYGIEFFYEGNEKWPDNIPKRGKEAEKGCIGCGWYDLDRWRWELNKQLKENYNSKTNH